MKTLLKLDKIIKKNNSLVCVGLDSDFDKLPQHLKKQKHPQFEFNKAIIDATHDLVSTYKPNSAFYEARGSKGLEELEMTVDYLKRKYPEIFIILDAKRADIGNTNEGYVKYSFDYLGADAITLHPYLGKEALQPFLERKDKISIILCHTTNQGAEEIQDVSLDGTPFYQLIAEKVVRNWNKNNNCMMVLGAKYPNQLSEVRKIAGDMTFLVPGIGAQGGDLEATVRAGINSKKAGMIINSSRGIIFASSGKDFAQKARIETEKLKNEINEYRFDVTSEEVIKMLKKSGAVITDSHIVYTSGKHGSVYINKDALYPHTEFSSNIGKLFAEKNKKLAIDSVAAPALGGIILSQWTAYHLSKLMKKETLGVYTEKDAEKNQVFTRGYDKLVKGKRVLVVEDLTTTGGSVAKVVKSVKNAGGNVVMVCVMVNRDPEKVTSEVVGAPFSSLAVLKAEAWDEKDCKLCKTNVPINTSVGHGKKYLEAKGVK